MTDHQTMKGIKLLEGLSDSAIEDLEKKGRWKTYNANEQIIDRQSDSNDVFFVIRGRVRVVIYSLAGREITLDDLVDGDHFGELAAIDPQPRSANVMALTKSTMCALPANYFLELLQDHPVVALRVMQHLTQIIRVSTERIMDLSTLGAANRVHAELLRQARDCMLDENSAMISPIPVHGDIGSRVSSTRETVARVMNDLARKNIVSREKNGLLIRDLEQLRDMVEDVRGE